MEPYSKYSTWNGMMHGNYTTVVYQGPTSEDGYIYWCAVYDMDKIEDRRLGYPELNDAKTRFVVHDFWYLPDPYSYENGFLESRYRKGKWEYCVDLEGVFAYVQKLGIPISEFGPKHRFDFPM